MGLNASVNPEFWRGKRVFLTGHTGFKGSWLSLWLQMLGTELTGFALGPPTTPSLFQEANVAKGMISIEGDIRDLDHLRESMESASPEIIIHMAAQPLVRYSYQNPVETYATNVMGIVNVLEAVRNTSGVHCVVNVTTDKCYDNKELDRPYQEEDPMGGHDPYSSSKGCAELVSAAYRSSFFNPQDYTSHGVALATARAGNVIGGGDWAKDRLIPDIIRAFEKGRIAQIRNPHAVRPWQHVMEPLRGYLVLAEKLINEGAKYSEGWNFGPKNEDARPVEWIVEQMASNWGDSARWESDSGEHPHEAGLLKLDISKVRNRLGWKPCLDLNDALNLVIDWAQEHKQGAQMRVVTQNQILTYQNAG